MKKVLAFVLLAILIIVVSIGLVLFTGEATSSFTYEEAISKVKNEFDAIVYRNEVVIKNNKKGLTVKITNREQLNRQIEEFGFWKDQKVANLIPNSQKTTASKIIFEISPDFFADNNFVQRDSDNSIFYTIQSSVAEDGTVKVKLWLENGYYQQPQGKDFINWGFWYGLYLATKDESRETRNEGAQEFAVSMLNKGHLFVY